MPLDATNFVFNGHLTSADMRGFYDLFTGVMTDQPVSFGNDLSIAGITMLSRDPQVPLEAATKQYVDQHSFTLSWPLLAPPSTAGTPNYSFAGDADTGLYSPGPGQMNLALESVDALTLGAAGMGVALPSNFAQAVQIHNGVAIVGGAATGNGTVPPGGTAGQVLGKQTATDYDLIWTVGGGGGGTTSIQVFEQRAVTGLTVTVPQIPAANGVISVSINGQELQSVRDWTIAGNVITFSSALSGDDVRVEYWTAPFNPGQYASHYETTLPTGATSFSLPVIPSGTPLLTRGGVTQYTTQGHYSLSGAVVNLGAPVGATEDGHFSVDYITGGGTDAATVGGLSASQLLAKTNLLTNPGFEICQRGNGPWTTHAVYTADRWQTNVGASDAVSFARDATNTHSSPGVAMAATVTTVVSTVLGLVQAARLPADGGQVIGKTFTFAAWVRTSTPNAVRLWLYTNVSNFMSAYHSGSGQWERLTLTVTLPGTDNAVLTGFNFMAACTAYLDDATLVVGSTPADYMPLHPADDLARCLRYYEVIGPGSSFPQVTGYSTAGQPIGASLPFAAKKAVAPTITLSGTWGYNNCTNIGQFGPTVGGVYLQATVTATGVAWANSSNSGIVVAEANP